MVLEGVQRAGRVSFVPSSWLVPTPLGANGKQQMFVCCLQRGGNSSNLCLMVTRV